jgi:flagellar hook assembly protein FlgD
MQNYPNPFKPSATGRGASTEIAYSLGQDASNVEIAIYSVKGELVTTLRSEANASGAGSVLWDGRDASGAVVSSGIYLYRLKADDRPMLCKRMILMR